MLVALLLPILLGLAVPLLAGPFPAHRSLAQIGLGLAGLAWAAAVLVSRRVGDSLALRWAILGGALCLRVAVAAGDPRLSDDVERYLWEGALVAEGTSPYAFAPSSPERAPQRRRWPEVYAGVNHADVSAAYPPAAQAAFAAVLGVSGGVEDGGARARKGMRLLFTLCDLAVLGLLLTVMGRRGPTPAPAVLWGWSPLVALEFAGSAHFDSLGILLLLAAALALDRGERTVRARDDDRRRGAENVGLLCLMTSALVKLLPIAFLPFALRDVARRDFRDHMAFRGAGRAVRAALLVVAVSTLWFLWMLSLEGGLRGIARGASEYALRWESFSLLYRWIERPLALLLASDGGPLDVRRVARGLVLLAWLGILLQSWRRGASVLDASLPVIGGFLLLTPTLHPWYLTWAMPFLALRPSLSWIFLVAVAPLLYWPLTEWQERGEWLEPGWLWSVVALPFLALLGLEWVRDARRIASDGRNAR